MHKMSKEEFLFRYKKDIERKKKKEEEMQITLGWMEE